MLDLGATALADAVLAYVKYLADDDGPTIHVFPYHNGREHGHSFVCWPPSDVEPPRPARGATVSEYRNSDNIVLYTGDAAEFHNGVPSEAVYWSQKSFYAWNEAAGAAREVLAWLYFQDVIPTQPED